jgi:isopentenyl-diphosphate delta-isomerase
MDPKQKAFLEEQCIQVDRDDKPIGPVSKEESHKNVNIKAGLLHRAFSVFLFNSKGQLLLHQRAKEKITFPSYWTNSCCSHPLYTGEEMEEKGHLGVKRAAVRKLAHELGIKEGAIGLDELHFLTKIHYEASSDGEWGEHEIDHILFVRKDVSLNLNPNEIQAVRWVNPSELKELFAEQDRDPDLYISPWFQMIAENFLFGWWETLGEVIKNKGIAEDPPTIHRLELAKPKPRLDHKSPDGEDEDEDEKDHSDREHDGDRDEERDDGDGDGEGEDIEAPSAEPGKRRRV